MLLRVVGPVETIEITGHLDRGISVQRRTGRNALVDLDRELGLLERFIKVANQKQASGRMGLKNHGQWRKAHPGTSAAAPADQSPKPVNPFGGPGRGVATSGGSFSPALSL